jgi:glycine/D-amino acid oxidase-like deaminating enzyme/nitrite reductase/ring-hydroxylating ferredoxin subunit
MKINSTLSQSLWMATAPTPAGLSLERHESADVVVIGAGIAGLSTAYELAAAGEDVVVVDRNALARGMTARTSGHLTWSTDDEFSRLITIHGAPKARLYFDSHAAAIDRIEHIQLAEGIACQFARIPGYLFAAKDDASLVREMRAMEKLDIPGATWTDRAPLPGIDTGRCLHFSRQARFHPLRYLNGLVEAIRHRGGRLYADTTVTNIKETASGVTVTTEHGHRIKARNCVIATNAPILIAVGVHEKQTPYRSYVLTATIPSGDAEDALIWDTLDPYHYVRLQPGAEGTDLLILGGEDHKSGTTNDMEKRFARIEQWGLKHFPSLGDVVHRWSGQVLEPRDCLAYIGRKPASKHIYFSTGDSGDGLTHAVVASMVLRDLIIKGESPWADLYSPARRPAKAPAKFHRDRAEAKAAKPRKLLDADKLRPGQGAIVHKNRQDIATFRDELGRLHQSSAKCTHAGCTVQWNGFERCWDCPCHGSQFAADGTAINAPAVEALEPVERKDEPAHRSRYPVEERNVRR